MKGKRWTTQFFAQHYHVVDANTGTPVARINAQWRGYKDQEQIANAMASLPEIVDELIDMVEHIDRNCSVDHGLRTKLNNALQLLNFNKQEIQHDSTNRLSELSPR